MNGMATNILKYTLDRSLTQQTIRNEHFEEQQHVSHTSEVNEATKFVEV